MWTKIKKFFSGIKTEVKVINWPTMAAWRKNCLVALGVTVLIGLIVWAFDGAAQAVVRAVLTII